MRKFNKSGIPMYVGTGRNIKKERKRKLEYSRILGFGVEVVFQLDETSPSSLGLEVLLLMGQRLRMLLLLFFFFFNLTLLFWMNSVVPRVTTRE